MNPPFMNDPAQNQTTIEPLTMQKLYSFLDYVSITNHDGEKHKAKEPQTNLELFINQLTKEYTDLFKNDPDYAYSASKTTPAVLASKMALSLIKGSASKDGLGIKRTCKFFNIGYTYKAIKEFLET